MFSEAGPHFAGPHFACRAAINVLRCPLFESERAASAAQGITKNFYHEAHEDREVNFDVQAGNGATERMRAKDNHEAHEGHEVNFDIQAGNSAAQRNG